MKIPVCHHYWQNRENARWSPAAFPVPEIEARVKGEYPLLQKDRPPFRVYDRWSVFFAYKPDKDIYGRPICPMSFAFVRDCANPEKLSASIAPLLAQAAIDDARLTLPDPSTGNKKRAITIALSAIFLLALWFFWPRAKPVESQPEPAAKIAPPDSPKSPEICDPAVLSALYLCPASYLKKYCANPNGNIPSYKSWFAEAPQCAESRRNAFSADENAVLKRNDLEPELKRRVKLILFDSE